MATSPTNLNEYYTQQGQALPTVQQRQDVATKAGITGYTGTAQQNGTLLGYLTGLPANKGTGTQAPITATSLQNTPTPIVTPTPVPQSTAVTDNSIAGLLATTKNNVATDQATQDAKTKELEGLITSQGDQGVVENKIYADNGVDTLKKQTDDYTSQIEAEQKALKDKIDGIRQNPNGMSAQGIQAEIERAQTESSGRQANTALLLSETTRQYATATAIATRQVEQNTAKLKASIDAKTFVLNQLGTKLATEQAQAFQLQSKQLDYKQDMLKEAITNAQKAVENGTIDGTTGYQAVSDLISGKTELSQFNNKIGNTDNTDGILDGVDYTSYATK